MMDRPLTVLVSLTGAVVVAASIKVLTSKDERHLFPPGPKPRFLIGNLLDIPLKDASSIYWKWSKYFNSSLLHFYALGQRIIVINGREDADELFENRARIYSDRPFLATTEMVGWEYNVALFPYGEYWRMHRRICQQNFKAGTSQQFYPIQKRKIHDMLLGLLDSPDNFEGHNKLLSISVALATMYGYEAKSLDDPVIKAADRGFDSGIKVISPGGSFANVFPPLKYVPWTWTQRLSKEAWRLTQEVKRIPLDALRRDLRNGTAIPSLVGNFMEKKRSTGASEEEEEATINVANTIYVAASDTTISAILSFIYFMATHPDVQAQAQAEVDRVIGTRLPSFEDKAVLPYTDALYREVLRRCPPVPMSLPHATSEDDWYKGYFIPKGTIILGNIWAMNHDETRYPNPMTFKPERFLDEQGEVIDDRIMAYGFGRRVCAGKHVANEMSWLTMTSILTCFTIRKKQDIDGNDIEIDDHMEEVGVVSHKSSFQCDIVPRSDAHRELVEGTRNQGYEF
ncbi:cytochrome P450 [Panaeolus papilionaceus]|nr:cytochrome P450 [Panaeolus papilionaceus]